MHIAEIIYLCVLVAVAFLFIGYGIAYYVAGFKCDHQFEEVLNRHSYAGPQHVVAYMCKKCGKIKVIKVKI